MITPLTVKLRKTGGAGFLLIFCFLLYSVATHAQVVESDERPLLYSEDGISFSKDSLFLMNLRFRMQNRAGFNTVGGDEFGIEAFEMRVRRLRLRFDGFVMHPRFQYYIQLAFSKADLDLEVGSIAQPVRDAILYYSVSENFYVGFGQSKLPGNRQRVISSGNLQFADRSLVNALFTLDRDFGFFGYYSIRTKTESIWMIKGAVTTGDGRNASGVNDGLSYTGRLEFLPFGSFSNSGDYSEGDLEFETNPKLSLGLSLNKNFKAIRTGGQLGAELFESRDMGTLIIDGIYKHKGWAVQAEFLSRSATDPITENDLGEIRYIVTGHGLNTQCSKLISHKSEFALRYSFVVPSEQIQALQQRTDEVLLGYTRYLSGHRIKVQGNVGYRWLDGLEILSNAGNTWTGMFQVEFGI
ncbi:porin [Pararhodonellum marinum]|uniref:porin n=1 Tax=Pararhodonellum marinum TaxID=2755358 RepID=UPI00188E44E6|nr:porin [Pararhodonellum marinum]